MKPDMQSDAAHAACEYGMDSTAQTKLFGQPSPVAWVAIVVVALAAVLLKLFLI